MILFKNALILKSDGSYIKDGYLTVENSKITYVGKDEPTGEYSRVIDCSGKMLMPAFYNIHCHAAMTLFRGLGADLPLDRWLNEKIYPAEDRLTNKAVRVGSYIAAAEMIKFGVVSFSDMYFFSDETAKAVIESGMKANISRSLVSFDENATIKGDTRFSEAKSLVETYNNAAEGRVIIDMAVHAEYTNKAKYCAEVADYTHANNLNMQVHLSETYSEHEACIERNGGKTPTEFLTETGILVPSEKGTVTAAHCVYVTDNDIEIMKNNSVNVAHNPVSNLKLASGVMPLAKMLDAGLNVGLGTDGVASNNSLSILRELQFAALIHKGVNRKADITKASEICKLATENGAIAQGRRDCGRIEAGYKADIILIDLDSINNIPFVDPASTLAYSAKESDVVLTMCDGKILYENGEYKTIDIESLKSEAKETIEHYYD